MNQNTDLKNLVLLTSIATVVVGLGLGPIYARHRGGDGGYQGGIHRFRPEPFHFRSGFHPGPFHPNAGFGPGPFHTNSGFHPGPFQ
jgi:hypothetical protein